MANRAQASAAVVAVVVVLVIVVLIGAFFLANDGWDFDGNDADVVNVQNPTVEDDDPDFVTVNNPLERETIREREVRTNTIFRDGDDAQADENSTLG